MCVRVNVLVSMYSYLLGSSYGSRNKTCYSCVLTFAAWVSVSKYV
jgi:hypothetical protein